MKRFAWLFLPLALALAWWLAAHWQTPAEVRLPPDPSCDIASGPCVLRLPGGDVLRLRLTPSPPPLMKPIAVEVTISGPAERVWLDLVGMNMDMGPNRRELTRSPGGQWQGEVIIPVCSSAEMRWEARVMVVRDGRTTAAPFPFVTRP